MQEKVVLYLKAADLMSEELETLPQDAEDWEQAVGRLGCKLVALRTYTISRGAFARVTG